jgi:hypothetical protein
VIIPGFDEVLKVPPNYLEKNRIQRDLVGNIPMREVSFPFKVVKPFLALVSSLILFGLVVERYAYSPTVERRSGQLLPPRFNPLV